MILGIGQLITAHVVIATALAGLNLYSSLSWQLKSLLVSLTVISYFIIYFAYAPLLGWPSTGPLPMRFNLVAAYGQEPDEVTGRRGRIFFWVSDKDSNDITPRAYEVDFDPQLHARIKEAMQRKHKSIPQTGTVEPDLEHMGVAAREERKGYKTQKFKIRFADEVPEAPPGKFELPGMETGGASAEITMPVPADEGANGNE